MVIWIKCTHPIHFSSFIPKISMFTLANSCLTISNLPWFTDLTFQIPMQYCSLPHCTLLSPPDTSKTKCHFHFSPASSFFLELYLHSSPVVYWRPTNLGNSSSGVICFLPFHTVHGFLEARILKWFSITSPGLPYSAIWSRAKANRVLS